MLPFARVRREETFGSWLICLLHWRRRAPGSPSPSLQRRHPRAPEDLVEDVNAFNLEHTLLPNKPRGLRGCWPLPWGALRDGLPKLMAWMRSEMVMMTFMMCSTDQDGDPAVPDFPDQINASSSSEGFRPAAVSSRRSSSGFVARARAISSLFALHGKALCRLVFFAEKVAKTEYAVRLGFRLFDGVDPAERGSGHIVKHRHSRKGFHDLEGAADPQVADLVGLEALML